MFQQEMRYSAVQREKLYAQKQLKNRHILHFYGSFQAFLLTFDLPPSR